MGGGGGGGGVHWTLTLAAMPTAIVIKLCSKLIQIFLIWFLFIHVENVFH